MPACRGVYLTHPTTGESGLWVELSTSPVGVLTGMAVGAWQIAGGDTLIVYQSKIQATYQNMFNLPQNVVAIFGLQPPNGWVVGADGNWYPMVVQLTLTLADFTHITSALIAEGALRQIKV